MQGRSILRSKGMFSQSRLVYLVLALIIGVVLFYFIYQADRNIDKAAEERCRISVERNAKLRIGELALGPELDCETREITIGNDLSQDEAKEKIAREMYACWRQFGQGKLNLFKEKAVYCNICSLITIETNDPIENFAKYLKDTNVPSLKTTYYEYLSGFSTSSAEEEVESSNTLEGGETELENDGTIYSVIFVYARGEGPISKIKAALLTAGAVSYLPPVLNIIVGVRVWKLSDVNQEWYAFSILKKWKGRDNCEKNSDCRSTEYELHKKLGCQKILIKGEKKDEDE